MRICAKCGNTIPRGRIEALPHTTTCVRCSDVKAFVGFMDWGHKTAPEIVLVPAEDREGLRRAQRINCRSR